MSSRNICNYLNDILDEIDVLVKLESELIDKVFKKRIIERSIEKIAEAINYTSTKYNINWNEFNKIIDIRNIIVHEYFKTDYSIIDKVIAEKFPELKKLTSSIITSQNCID